MPFKSILRLVNKLGHFIILLIYTYYFEKENLLINKMKIRETYNCRTLGHF